MNFRKMTDPELVKFINSTNDIGLLQAAEEEYVNRHGGDSSARWDLTDQDEEEILISISKTWRPS